MIPSKDKDNLIVDSFAHYNFEGSDFYLEDYDFNEYENKLIGFFVTLNTTQDYFGEWDSELIPGEVTVIAEDGKMAFIHNLKKFDQCSSIDLDDLMEFCDEDLDDLFESLSLEDIQLEKPLFDLDELKAIEPDFLNYSEEEINGMKEFENLNEFENNLFAATDKNKTI
jgi:hypothetical protein